MKRKSEGERIDVYTKITDRIIADLEQGVRPWIKPWNAAHTEGRISRPLRHNGTPYSGLNVLLLWSEGIARGFTSPMWMTFKQSLELGAAVRKGETGSIVVFASRFTKLEVNGNGGEVDREIPFLKAYTVFNVAQIDGLPDHYYHPPTPVMDPVKRIAEVDRFFKNTGAVIRHGGNQAFFSPSSDHIQMPELESFRDVESYYATLGHEEIHWVGAPHRVDRDLSRYHKDRTFRAREELCAELGSCFLCADLGISPELKPRQDHARYLNAWLEVLSGDRRAIFQAAAHAQRAVNYLHSLQPQAGIEDVREAA